MTDERKPRVDSAEEQVRMMAALAKTGPITPPVNVPLDDIDLPFFYSVIDEFAKSEWTSHQLELAAILARNMADLTRESIDLRAEGSIIYTEKGTPVVNPRKTIIQMCSSTILAMRRSLALHARGKAGDNRAAGRSASAAKDVEKDNPLEDEDELLATPVN